MANLDSGIFALDLQSTDAHTQIGKVCESFSVMLEKKKGKIYLQLDATQNKIQADPIHLFNVLYNILDNAIKFSQRDPEILIKTADSAEGLVISISDNGIGMNREVQRQVFDRFFRQKNGDIHDKKGFGLGLAYVKSIVKAHGGQVFVESQVDSGSRFQLLFPYGSKYNR